MVKKKKISELQIWKGFFIRAFVIGGMCFFTESLLDGIVLENLTGAFLLAGVYLFAEAMKYYKIDPTSISRKSKTYQYKFLIL